MYNFDVRTWSAPHWLTVIGGAVGGAVVEYFATIPADELLSDITTSQGWLAIGKGALIAGLAAFIGVAKQILAPQAQATANALAKGELK